MIVFQPINFEEICSIFLGKSIITAFFLADLSTRIILSVPKILLGGPAEQWPRVSPSPVQISLPRKAKWGSEKNDDIFGFRPVEVLGSKTPAFCFEVKFVYISCTNVENYLPSNNFGYRTIFIFLSKETTNLDTKIYDVSFWMSTKWAPYDGPGYQRAYHPYKLPCKWVTVGIFHPDKWSSGCHT